MMSARATPTRAANASFVWTIRSSLIGDDDEIDERVERVFEQPALPQDLLEQLDVLDPDRELAAEIVRELDELRARPSSPASTPFDDERAERAAPAAQRGDERRRRQPPGARAAGPCAAGCVASSVETRAPPVDGGFGRWRSARVRARDDRAARRSPRTAPTICVISIATVSSAVARFSVAEMPREKSSRSSRSRRCRRISRRAPLFRARPRTRSRRVAARSARSRRSVLDADREAPYEIRAGRTGHEERVREPRGESTSDGSASRAVVRAPRRCGCPGRPPRLPSARRHRARRSPSRRRAL